MQLCAWASCRTRVWSRAASVRSAASWSPAWLHAAHGAPQTPNDLLNHEALMQGTESWRLVDRGKTVVIRPQGRFKPIMAQLCWRLPLPGSAWLPCRIS